jgi:hypothetical protein
MPNSSHRWKKIPWNARWSTCLPTLFAPRWWTGRGHRLRPRLADRLPGRTRPRRLRHRPVAGDARSRSPPRWASALRRLDGLQHRCCRVPCAGLRAAERLGPRFQQCLSFLVIGVRGTPSPEASPAPATPTNRSPATAASSASAGRMTTSFTPLILPPGSGSGFVPDARPDHRLAQLGQDQAESAFATHRDGHLSHPGDPSDPPTRNDAVGAAETTAHGRYDHPRRYCFRGLCQGPGVFDLCPGCVIIRSGGGSSLESRVPCRRSAERRDHCGLPLCGAGSGRTDVGGAG